MVIKKMTMSSSSSLAAARYAPTERWKNRYREVLDAAATEFADKGYSGASTKDIANRLGIRAAGLYYYLPSKEAFLAAICEDGVQEFLEHLRVIHARPVSGAEKIRLAIANHLSPLRKRPAGDYIRVFLRHRHELPRGPRHTVALLANDYQNLIECIFADGIASGEFRSDLSAPRATLGLLGLCNSVIGARALPRNSSIDDFIEEYSRLVIFGVTSPDAHDKKPDA
jgi:AcrR family transcriptional regulator